MRSACWGVICAGLCTLVFSGVARAAIITFDFDARVTAVGQVNSFGGTSINDVFSGSFTFDSTAAGPGGVYSFSGGAPIGLTTQVGNRNVAITDFSITIRNAGGDDRYRVDGSVGSGLSEVDFFFVLYDSNGSVFSDASLPLTPPSLAEFEVNRGEIKESQPTTLNPLTVFTITSLTVHSVPEPSSGLLLSIGVAVAALPFGRRRRP